MKNFDVFKFLFFLVNFFSLQSTIIVNNMGNPIEIGTGGNLFLLDDKAIIEVKNNRIIVNVRRWDKSEVSSENLGELKLILIQKNPEEGINKPSFVLKFYSLTEQQMSHIKEVLVSTKAIIKELEDELEKAKKNAKDKQFFAIQTLIEGL